MNYTLNENYFPGFSHAATEIIRFKESIEFFSVMLATGQVIHHFPTDITAFRDWLMGNEVPDVDASYISG